MTEQKFEYVNYTLKRRETGNEVKWKVENPMTDITPHITINFQEGKDIKENLWFSLSQGGFYGNPNSPLWNERKNALDEAVEAIKYFTSVINDNRVVSYTIDELYDLACDNDITVEEILSHGDESLLKFGINVNTDLSSGLVRRIAYDAENGEDFYRLLSESLDEDPASNQMMHDKVWDFVDSALKYYIKGDNRENLYSNIDEMFHASLMDNAQSAYPIEYTFTDSLGLLKFI